MQQEASVRPPEGLVRAPSEAASAGRPNQSNNAAAARQLTAQLPNRELGNAQNGSSGAVGITDEVSDLTHQPAAQRDRLQQGRGPAEGAVQGLRGMQVQAQQGAGKPDEQERLVGRITEVQVGLECWTLHDSKLCLNRICVVNLFFGYT